jgi:ATP-dependent RNA helicase HrpB
MLRPPLPIDEVLPHLCDVLRRRAAAVLVAPTGAGKSTRVPLALLGAGVAADGLIVMLQPRRLAARAVARRMAELLDEPPGQTVGYQVRFERCASAQTRVLVVTEGILTRRLLHDPLLEGVGCVILDELHERSVHVDLALAFLRELQEARPELKLVAMSATLDAAPVAAYLNDCAQVRCEVRAHPLAVTYHRHQSLAARPLAQQVHGALLTLMRGAQDDGGDLLVFLPGAAQIQRTRALLAREGLPGDPELVALYGALSASEQDRALRPRAGQRRVVLATNIAETSLTVPGVTAVVDSGLVKRLRYDPGLGLDRLEQGRVSRQSADQRAGRAGRTAPGRVRRLWTEADQAGLAEAETPELQRVDLAPALLALLAFAPGDPRRFDFFERPPDSALSAGLELLELLGALSASGGGRLSLSPRGQRLAALPLHPRVGALIASAREAGLGPEGALLGALLGERDLLLHGHAAVPTGRSDLLHRRDLFLELQRTRFSEAAARRRGVDVRAARAVQQARDQLLGLIDAKPDAGAYSADEARLLELVLAGYPDRVCRRREPGRPGAVMVGGRGVELDASSGVREAELFVALSADAGRRGLHSTSLVRLASAVDEAALASRFSELISTQEELVFDEQQEAVVSRRRRRFVDLVLADEPGPAPDPAQTAALLAAAAAERFERLFAPDKEATQLLGRLRLAAAHLARGQQAWPDVSPAGLQALLPELCYGKRSLQELRGIDWAAELSGRLSHAQRALLDGELPPRLPVPSGRAKIIDYSVDPPVLAVKLQELFGQTETPAVARGKVRLLLHLLAPSGRPVQVTQDLRSFWDRTYAEVRKDLRGRYPKHPWPEDPYTAPATSRTKRRR